MVETTKRSKNLKILIKNLLSTLSKDHAIVKNLSVWKSIANATMSEFHATIIVDVSNAKIMDKTSNLNMTKEMPVQL